MPRQILHVDADGAALHADSGMIVAARRHRVMWLSADMEVACDVYLVEPVLYGAVVGRGEFAYSSGDAMWIVRTLANGATVDSVPISENPLTPAAVYCGVGEDPETAWFYDDGRANLVAVGGVVCGGHGNVAIYAADEAIYAQNMATGAYQVVAEGVSVARVYVGADSRDLTQCAVVYDGGVGDGGDVVWFPDGFVTSARGSVIGVWFTCDAPVIVSYESASQTSYIRNYVQVRDGVCEDTPTEDWQSAEGVQYDWVWNCAGQGGSHIAMDISGRLVVL